MRRLADVSQGDVVLPGDRLCVIEELSPSHGTYEEQGIVYAATLGGVDIDLKSRSISVRNPDGSIQLHLPVKDDILTGEVLRVFDQRAEVILVRRNGKDLLSTLQGEIHISNVTRRFVKSMHDALREGDIIRAVALNTHTIPVELSLVGQDLGVLYAKCVKCGNELTLTTHNNLYCLRCENRGTREVANDYGADFNLEARPDLAPRRRSYDDRRYGGRDRRYDRDRGSRSGGRRYDDRRGGRDRRGGGGRRNSYRRDRRRD